MARHRRRAHRRHRVGRVSYYFHHGAWYVYYRDSSRQVRRRIGPEESEAAQVAAQLNADLSSGTRAPRSFEPITVAELRRKFLAQHESVRNSSLATVHRYRTATLYAERFAHSQSADLMAHELDNDALVRWLRGLSVSPNGHPNSPKRPLREKGIRFILETCRAMYRYAAKRRHLPPYFDNPFAELAATTTRTDEASPIFVFDAEMEARFLGTADPRSFPIHFALAKTGLRPGELAHLLVEDLDLDRGWLHVRSKPELRWRVKTRREHAVPLVGELVEVLRSTIDGRQSGPVFRRLRFQDRRDSQSETATGNREALAHLLRQRISIAERESGCRKIFKCWGYRSTSRHCSGQFIALMECSFRIWET